MRNWVLGVALALWLPGCDGCRPSGAPALAPSLGEAPKPSAPAPPEAGVAAAPAPAPSEPAQTEPSADASSRTPAAGREAAAKQGTSEAAGLPDDYLRRKIAEGYRERRGKELSEERLDEEVAKAKQWIGRSLARQGDRLAEQDAIRDARGLQSSGTIRLQARVAAIGGNPCKIDMVGRARAFIRRTLEKPFEWKDDLSLPRQAEGYANGGYIPAGQVFVVTKVRYIGFARGDSNGGGELKIVVGGLELADREDDGTIVEAVWEGIEVIAEGEEDSVYLVVSNSSAGDVTIEGHLVPAAQAPEESQSSHRFLRGVLREPRFRFQLVAGEKSQDHVRLKPLGGERPRGATRSAEPIAPVTALPPGRSARWHGPDGGVPPGKRFIVTKVTGDAHVRTELFEHGTLVLRTPRTVLFKADKATPVLRVDWAGELEIGADWTNSLEVQLFGPGGCDLLIEGRFEDKR